MSEDKVVSNIVEYGNIFVGFVLIVLCEVVESGVIKEDDIIVFVGFGVGFMWVSVIWKF